jgi:PAS domain S-box-containing protein
MAKQSETIGKYFESVISSIKKMEENSAIFKELGKISSDLSKLNNYIQQGLGKLETNYVDFIDSINLLSDLIDFQKKVIHFKSSEKTIKQIFAFLEENIQFDTGFILYKLKEEATDYEFIASNNDQNDAVKDFLQRSKIDNLKKEIKESELSVLINDVNEFSVSDINWSALEVQSALVFLLKARGQIFGLGILVRQNSAFEIRDKNLINLLTGLISLLVYQNLYFAILKARLIHQSTLIKTITDPRYADFMENGPVFIFTLDRRFVVLHTNKTAKRNVKIEGDSVIGEDFFEIISPVYRSAFRKSLLKLQGKPFQIHRYPIRSINGSFPVFEFLTSPVKMENGPDFILVLAWDITENYIKESIEKRNEILEEIDQFSRILVTQFNNLLNTILPNLNLLKTSLSLEDGNKDRLEVIQDAAQRSANMIHKFLNYDVEEKEEREEVNINKLLNSFLASVKKQIPDKMAIKLELDPKIKTTHLYSLKIRHIIDIIVKNSIIALENSPNPKIQFSTRLYEHKKSSVMPDKNYFLPAGNYIELCIRDNGIGIPKKSLTQVLKPFYSTRIKNEGVGLGLFIAYNLIKDMKGHIYIDSQIDQFTAVYLYLPFKEEKDMGAPSTTFEKSEPRVETKQGTILVVDDEYNIRSMMKEIMEMSGLKVFTAGNGQDGLDLYKQNRREIDLIIMDMVMPIMDGREAFKEIRKLNPEQKIFIISGYSQREDMEDLLENGAVGFMRKPFQVREIVDKVNEILGINN